jgi:hypothetical protein
LALVSVISYNTIVCFSRHSAIAILVLHLIAGDIKGGSFIFGNIVREEVALAIVRHIVYI